MAKQYVRIIKRVHKYDKGKVSKTSYLLHSIDDRLDVEYGLEPLAVLVNKDGSFMRVKIDDIVFKNLATKKRLLKKLAASVMD